MRLKDDVRQLLDAHDWAGLFGYYTADIHLSGPEQIALGLLLAVIVLGGVLSLTSSSEAAGKLEVRRPQMGGPSLLHRLVHRHQKPVTVGGVTFDRAWRHVGIVATTGARKSTLLALLADQLRVPCVIITGDYAPPLDNWTRSVAGWVWTARGDVAWYPWGGPLELAVQRVEYMFPATGADVGVHRALFKQAARRAWGASDDAGVPRTLGQVIALMPSTIRGQSSAAMVEHWTARLREMEQSLAGSLGTDLDLVEMLRQGTSVMFSLNSFQDLSNRSRFASIAVLEALRAAETLGNIGVVIDEVGLVGADLFADAVRTFRVRKVTGLFASQIAEDFPGPVRGNVSVWFLGQQSGGDKKSRQWSSDTTFGLVPPEHFGEHELPYGRFYVVAGARVQVATIPTWKPRKVHPPRPLAHVAAAYNGPAAHVNGEAGTQKRVIRIESIERVRPVFPELPPPSGRGESEQLRRALAKYLYVEGGCERWRGKHDRKGYGQVWVDGQWDYIHIVRWEAAYGKIERDEDGRRVLTLDHVYPETCAKDCSTVLHLEAVTRAENTRRRWRRQGVGVS